VAAKPGAGIVVGVLSDVPGYKGLNPAASSTGISFSETRTRSALGEVGRVAVRRSHSVM